MEFKRTIVERTVRKRGQTQGQYQPPVSSGNRRKERSGTENRSSGYPLRTVCVIGLILALVVSWGMVLFGVIWRRDIPSGARVSGNAFARELREYDLFDGPKRALEGIDPQQIERRLSMLQRRVRGVEEQLSVLKRRRALALLDRRYIDAYEKAGREAAQTYPYSAPVAAVAAEAVTIGSFSAGGGEDSRSLLRTYAGRVTQDRFELLELSIHILAGNMEDPARAAALPGLENLLSRDLAGFPDQIRTALLSDEFLLRAVKGDIPGAVVRLNTLLSQESSADTPEAAQERFISPNCRSQVPLRM